MELSRAALAFRAGHTAIAIEQLLAIAYVCWCALTGRCDSLLRIAVATLLIESVLVVANRRDCPWGGLQQRLGDPVPLFELVLSPRAARRAVPTLGAITTAGLALLVVCGRRDRRWRGSKLQSIRCSCLQPRREPLLLLICFSSEKGPFHGHRGAYAPEFVERMFCELRV